MLFPSYPFPRIRPKAPFLLAWPPTSELESVRMTQIVLVKVQHGLKSRLAHGQVADRGGGRAVREGIDAIYHPEMTMRCCPGESA